MQTEGRFNAEFFKKLCPDANAHLKDDYNIIPEPITRPGLYRDPTCTNVDAKKIEDMYIELGEFDWETRQFDRRYADKEAGWLYTPHDHTIPDTSTGGTEPEVPEEKELTCTFNFVSENYGMTRYTTGSEYNPVNTQVVQDGIPVIITVDDHSRLWSESLRLYSNAVLSIANPGGTIIKVEITVTTSAGAINYIKLDDGQPGEYNIDGVTGTWEGNANEIIFKCNQSHSRVASITITYKGGSTEAVNLVTMVNLVNNVNNALKILNPEFTNQVSNLNTMQREAARLVQATKYNLNNTDK